MFNRWRAAIFLRCLLDTSTHTTHIEHIRKKPINYTNRFSFMSEVKRIKIHYFLKCLSYLTCYSKSAWLNIYERKSISGLQPLKENSINGKFLFQHKIDSDSIFSCTFLQNWESLLKRCFKFSTYPILNTQTKSSRWCIQNEKVCLDTAQGECAP